MDDCAICSRERVSVYDALTGYGVLPLCDECYVHYAREPAGETVADDLDPDVYTDACWESYRCS